MALHPSGFLLLAGFADRLRLMTVLAGGPLPAGLRGAGRQGLLGGLRQLPPAGRQAIRA